MQILLRYIFPIKQKRYDHTAERLCKKSDKSKEYIH
jgi:hypothetical protein